MSAGAIIEKAAGLGIALSVVEDRIQCRPGSLVQSDLLEELRAHKADVIQLLERQQTCRNRLTPHLAHEHPWECTPVRMLLLPRVSAPFPLPGCAVPVGVGRRGVTLPDSGL